MGGVDLRTQHLATTRRGHHYVVAPAFFVESTVLSTNYQIRRRIMGRDSRTDRYQQILSEQWQDQIGGNDLGDNPDKHYIQFMEQIPGILPSTITAEDSTDPFTKTESRYYQSSGKIK